MRAAFTPMSPCRRATSSARRRRCRARRAHAHHDVVDEAEEARGLARLEHAVGDFALGRPHLGDLPAEATRRRAARARGPRRRGSGDARSARGPDSRRAAAPRRRPGSSCRGPRSRDRRARLEGGGSSGLVVMSLMRGSPRPRATPPHHSRDHRGAVATPSQARPRPCAPEPARVRDEGRAGRAPGRGGPSRPPSRKMQEAGERLDAGRAGECRAEHRVETTAQRRRATRPRVVRDATSAMVPPPCARRRGRAQHITDRAPPVIESRACQEAPMSDPVSLGAPRRRSRCSRSTAPTR